VITTYVNFHAPINEKTVQTLMAIVSQTCQAGTTELHLLLSTPGGSVSSGITLYNFLRAVPVTLTIHNMGNVDSVGNAIFLAGQHRNACTHSTFMFHGVGFDLNNIHFKEQQLRESLASLQADQSRIAAIITDRTNLDASETADLFREARTKDANAALIAGIVHTISDVQIPAGTQILTIVMP
jgi:ATP-dependent protease ClpP protease subunit